MIIIYGTFPNYNNFVAAANRNRFAANAMKHKAQTEIIRQLNLHELKPFEPPIWIEYTFYEKNKRRDKDNVAGFFHKVFQDALVELQLLPDDGWHFIEGWSDQFGIDKEYPRIEINIWEAYGND
jgi:Holliday junction resolvase RusA-like endonuclease